MPEYSTQVVIDAPPDRVWAILIDGSRYAEWNPEIFGIDGRLAAGAKITASVRLGDGATRRVPMRVTELTAPARMVWTGGLPFGLFVGRRTYTVEPTAGGTRFSHASGHDRSAGGDDRQVSWKSTTGDRRIRGGPQAPSGTSRLDPPSAGRGATPPRAHSMA